MQPGCLLNECAIRVWYNQLYIAQGWYARQLGSDVELNSERQVNEKMKTSFLYKMGNSLSREELPACFEFKILFARTNIENFYNHLAII
jgi:hypothetical protein